MSKIANGKASLSAEHIIKIKENPYGWNTEFIEDELWRKLGEVSNSPQTSTTNELEMEVARLRAENETLRQQLIWAQELIGNAIKKS